MSYFVCSRNVYLTACLVFSFLSISFGFILPLAKVDGTLDVSSLISHLNVLEQSVSDLHKKNAATEAEVTSLKGRVTILEADKQRSLNETSNLKTELEVLKLRFNQMYPTNTLVNSTKPLGKDSHMLDSLKNTTSTLGKAIQTNKAEISRIATSLKTLNSSCIDAIKTTSNHSEGATQGVGFEVSALSTISSGSTGAVKFDMIQHNIGNGYNKTTGIFTAPVAGLYLFWVQFLQYHHQLAVSLYRSGKLQLQMKTPQPLTLSGVKSMRLAAGEKVYVQIDVVRHDYAFVYGYPHSSFGGVLLKH